MTRRAHLPRRHRRPPVPAPLQMATATIRFEPSPDAPHIAREFTHQALAEWEVSELDLDAQIVVSELVTRAVTAGSAGTLLVHRHGDVVRLEVTADKRLRPNRSGDLGERVLDVTSDHWGHDYTWPDYRTSWSDLSL